MFKNVRRLFYVQELREILEEEEKLLEEWEREWVDNTSSLVHHGVTGPGWYSRWLLHENKIFRGLWNSLTRMYIELRKLEEIFSLNIKGREEMSARDKIALRQIQVRLDKDLVGKQKSLLVDMADEKNRIKGRINEEKKKIIQLKRIAEKFLSRMKSQDKRWSSQLGKYLDSNEYRRYISEFSESWKEIFEIYAPPRKALSSDIFLEMIEKTISKCQNILNLFKRMETILQDIESKINKIK